MPDIERRQPTPASAQWIWPTDTHPVLRQVLSRRPIESPDELDLGLKHLLPVGRFDALQAGIDLLLAHRRGRIVVVGDFDADGATSTALALLVLRGLGFASVEYFIPDRFALGYGLSVEAVARLRPLEASLIVTVDNGISSVDGVEAAREAGIDVLITDHHLPPDRLPSANVIVNPNLPGDAFPGKQLAGIGVVFYLMAALARALDRPKLAGEYLDLVALGTVADLVPLDRQNRILVEQGLRRIRAGRCRPGVQALAACAGVELQNMTAAGLGYQLGPRLNAAGRLDDMSVGVRCLVSDSASEAARLASMLDGLNLERRAIESKMRAEAIDLVDEIQAVDADELPAVVCLLRKDWHEGLVGLIASRIKERCHRPVFAFAATESGDLKGSGRSIAGFHLRDALADVDSRHPGLIERFGGHAMAAGLTLKGDAFETFRAAVAAIAAARLEPEALTPRILTDGELKSADMNLQVASLLRAAGPWGQGFPEPRFDGEFELLSHRVLKDAHLKMSLRPADGAEPIDAIAFNRPSCAWEAGSRLRVVYRLAVNDYFATPTSQLIVEHLEAC